MERPSLGWLQQWPEISISDRSQDQSSDSTQQLFNRRADTGARQRDDSNFGVTVHDLQNLAEELQTASHRPQEQRLEHQRICPGCHRHRKSSDENHTGGRAG